MSCVIIDNGTVSRVRKSLEAVLDEYTDMYMYSVYIVGKLVYIVVKHTQPVSWDWAE